MLSSQPGSDDIRRNEPLARVTLEDGHEVRLTQLREQLSTLLAEFDSHDIALELQRLHNQRSEDQRAGYRMEIAMLSKDYQTGAYDSSL